MPPLALRPTYGCLREDDTTANWMSSNLPVEFPFAVVEDMAPQSVS